MNNRAVFWCALAFLGLLIPWRSTAGEEDTDAVWISKSTRFTYMGTTTRYSCEALRERVEMLLLQLGARRDLRVLATGCATDPRSHSSFPRLDVSMTVLHLARASPQAERTPLFVRARWKSVLLGLDGTNRLDPGDCELVEQARQVLLPLFTTRNVQENTTCPWHQPPTGFPDFKLEVLSEVAD